MADAPRRVSKWEHAFRAGRGDPVELVPHEEHDAMPDPDPAPRHEPAPVHVATAATPPATAKPADTAKKK